jgi:dTDP-4-dehydrorhamnose 3,5-epimerase
MKVRELKIKGVWLAQFPSQIDNRGMFREWFKADEIKNSLGRSFEVQQANISCSELGVIRGIHYSLNKNGQGKWITCVTGSIWDVVVDIRPTSPTFKEWIGVELNDANGEVLFVSEGLGHGFQSLQENSVVAYLLTSKFSKADEFGFNPLDPELGIAWPITQRILSTKDAEALSFKEQYESGRFE